LSDRIAWKAIEPGARVFSSEGEAVGKDAPAVRWRPGDRPGGFLSRLFRR